MKSITEALKAASEAEAFESAAVAASVLNTYLLAVRTKGNRQHITTGDIPNIARMLSIADAVQVGTTPSEWKSAPNPEPTWPTDGPGAEG